MPPWQGGRTGVRRPGEEGTRWELAPSLALGSVGPIAVPLVE